MLEVVLSNRFKKDLKLAAKRGCDLSLLESIVDQLAAQQPLPERPAITISPVITSAFVNVTSVPIGF